MKPENAIEVHNLVKTFRIYFDKGHTLKEITLFSKRRRFEERKVLNGISFSVKKGEAIGLVGHNGCGKSTTLKLLTRIMYPDSGEIEMRGRVSSLIELGAGFHPDMSGRENIYINASIFGLTRKEIDARLQTIIDFSELEQFIDNPVRTYSSGMYMRLAFAVAINVDADILLIDEILAVGDAGFQAKCFNKLKQIKAEGTTIVIVSHSLGQIEEICERSIWVHEGSIKAEGNPKEVHPLYLEYMGQKRQDIAAKEAAETEQKKEHGERPGSGQVRIGQVVLEDLEGNGKQVFQTGESMKLRIPYNVKERIENFKFTISFYRNDNTLCYSTSNKIERQDKWVWETDGEIAVIFPELMLVQGKYQINIAVESEDGFPIDVYDKAVEFEMFADIKDKGICRMKHQWEI